MFLRIAVLKNSEISQENIGGRGGLQTLRKTSLTLISLRVWGPPLWVKGGGERNDLPLTILFCNFMVTYLNFMKFGEFSQNLSGINTVDFFSKLELVFAVSTLFCSVNSKQGVSFCAFFVFFVFCWNNEYILESRGFRKKTYIDFCNNAFPINTAIINFGNSI